MNIAIIGSGGREHALYWKISQSPLANDVYVIPGNGGIPNSVEINIKNYDEIKKFCDLKEIELIIVGPELPLANGIVNYFEEKNIKIFGPSRKAALLESSKVWAKKFMSNYGVKTAEHFIVNNIAEANNIITNLNGELVIKYDGLAAGKGVYVCSNIKEAMNSVDELRIKFGDKAKFFIDKKLYGTEMSIIAITNGKDIKILSTAQDYKQLYDNNKGPNTGGMGAYCPSTFCNNEMLKDIEEAIVKPTLNGMKKENLNYKGFIYFGLMITDEGPKVLEYNVRLGDPETEVILPKIKTDLLSVILSCFNGALKNQEIEYNEGYFIDVVLTSKGYPKYYSKGHVINGLDDLNNDTLVFHAGTKKRDGKFITTGGRVLNIVVQESSLGAAREKVYKECEHIKFNKMYYRKDIGENNN